MPKRPEHLAAPRPRPRHLNPPPHTRPPLLTHAQTVRAPSDTQPPPEVAPILVKDAEALTICDVLLLAGTATTLERPHLWPASRPHAFTGSGGTLVDVREGA